MADGIGRPVTATRIVEPSRSNPIRRVMNPGMVDIDTQVLTKVLAENS